MKFSRFGMKKLNSIWESAKELAMLFTFVVVPWLVSLYLDLSGNYNIGCKPLLVSPQIKIFQTNVVIGQMLTTYLKDYQIGDYQFEELPPFTLYLLYDTYCIIIY